MFKREIKINLKSFLIWTIILIAVFLMAYLMYPSIISSETGDMIDEMMKIFPEEVLVAFNMDIIFAEGYHVLRRNEQRFLQPEETMGFLLNRDPF